MNRLSIAAVVLLLSGARAFADFPVYRGPYADVLPSVAYSSADREYFVVWSEPYRIGMSWTTAIRGQLLSENGLLNGSPFLIAVGSSPSVAYNSDANEFLVAFNRGSDILGQRVSNTLSLIGDPTSLIAGVTHARLLYNTLRGEYLCVGAVLQDNPAQGSGYKKILIYSRRIGADGQATTSPVLVDESPHGYQPPEPAFGAAFAPETSTETPAGRYLVVRGRGLALTMLDSDGAPIDIVMDPDHPGVRYRNLPFKTGSPAGGEGHVDVAYGTSSDYSMTGPAFRVVWADNNNVFSGQQWTGIYGGFVDARKILYLTRDIQDRSFPVSAIADHWAYPDDVESWRPKVSFNPSSQKFYVAWRETPGTSSSNDTKVKHIRGTQVFEQIPAHNAIISATAGTEDPKYPAICASTRTEQAMIVWQDARSSSSTGTDIYANVVKVGDQVPPPPPPPPVTRWVVTNTNDAGTGSLRQAMIETNKRIGLDTIAFDIPGSGSHTIAPASPLPVLTDPVLIDGYTQPGSQPNTNALKDPSNAALLIVLDGAALKGVQPPPHGLHLSGGNSIVRGLVITRFNNCAVCIDTKGGNTVEGCVLGGFAQSMVQYGNYTGVWIDDVAGNTVGGASPEARNIISDNSAVGVAIRNAGASGNHILGNYIGVTSAGNALLENATAGVSIYDASSNMIGGTTPDEGNVIGSAVRIGKGWSSGIDIAGAAEHNIVAGNLIGTNSAGDDSLTHTGLGIWLRASRNTVGGTVTGARNVISGNRLGGIIITGDNNLVQGNFVGTDRAGSRSLMNGDAGVAIYGSGNEVGGLAPEESNIISGGAAAGIQVIGGGTGFEARGNRIRGNRIGIGPGSGLPFRDVAPGVLVGDWALGTEIGGADEGAANIIAGQRSVGILVRGNASGTRISRNRISPIDSIGINLQGGVEDADGVTQNDAGDGDSGPNGLQNYPVITQAEGGDYLSVEGSLSSRPASSFTIEFFASDRGRRPQSRRGQTFIGWTEVTTDGAGAAGFSLTIGVPMPPGAILTATATDKDGNTSEFSAPAEVTYSSNDLLVTNTGDEGPGSLRNAILAANALPGSSHAIRFDIPGEGPHVIRPTEPLPEVTTPVMIDGYTQSGSEVNASPFAEGSNAVLMVELDGSSVSAYASGIILRGGNSTVRGMAINRFKNAGIQIDSKGGNKVEGCFLGTDIAGTEARPNSYGVRIDTVDHNTVGGISAYQRNVISGNSHFGVALIGTSCRNNTILGNYIGTTASGATVLGNVDAGVQLEQASANIIGGTATGAGNVISGSGQRGNATDPTIVGSGIFLSPDAAGNTVLGNLIGTNAAGPARLENLMHGVTLSGHSNTIGGSNPGGGNTISGCSLAGISVLMSGHAILGNRIGTDIAGSQPIGNMHGIRVMGAETVRIGGYGKGEANTIAFNDSGGISVEASSDQVGISGNSIYGNGKLGIDLKGGVEDGMGCTKNDPKDADTGPNGLQNCPVLTSAEGGEYLLVTGTLNSTPDTAFFVEFFATPADGPPRSGEGQMFLDWITVRTGKDGNASFLVTIGTPIAPGRAITATATQKFMRTSEFSAPVIATTTGVAVRGADPLPLTTALLQNYPNPFNPSTAIGYDLSERAPVKLTVYDLLGREVACLVNGEQQPGHHRVTFDGTRLASGTYLYRLTAGLYTSVRRMLLVR